MIGFLVTLGYVVVTILVGVITAAVIYARWHYGTLERVKGLPAIVKPAFVGGSDVWVYKKVVHDADTENVKKYGKVYGYYNGRTPQIYVADADMLREIFVKNFDHFQDKPTFDIADEMANESVDFLKYDKWKVVRQALSPNLSTGKIKHMSLIMTQVVDDWIKSVKNKVKGNSINLSKTEYTALSTDIIARCGFGVKLNSLDDPENPFVKHALNLVFAPDEPNFLLSVILTFPFLAGFIPILNPATMEFFSKVCKNVLSTRRDSKIKLNDLVDTLNEMYEKIPTEEYKRLEITEITVIAQALAMFVAGFETSAMALTLTMYHLAKYPKVQDKVLEEVDAYLARNDGKVEHETLNELVYLHACITETLRIFPSLIRLERLCTKEWRHEASGLVIPKGMVVEVPVFAVHFNPDYFEDPHTFEPERFLPQNKDKLHPYAYLPFGLGNHNCLGIRFAKESSLIAMTKVLQNFKFKMTPDTKVTMKRGSTFAVAVDPFSVEAVKRY